MLTANRLEKIMELEQELRAEYQQQLDDKQAAIDAALAEKTALQATIATQLETIQTLSAKAGDTQKVEQRNRELHNRADNLQTEIAALKQRMKALQKDLNAVREENKALNQFDPARMKKTLDASKKKIAEKQRDNESLQKALKESRKEQAALERRVQELEAAEMRTPGRRGHPGGHHLLQRKPASKPRPEARLSPAAPSPPHG